MWAQLSTFTLSLVVRPRGNDAAAILGIRHALRVTDALLVAHDVAKLDDAEMSANRNGASNDLKAAAAVRFAVKVAKLRGHVSDEDFRAIKATGYTDAQIIEIVQHVALNTWTNYINNVAKTEIDFPLIAARKVA